MKELSNIQTLLNSVKPYLAQYGTLKNEFNVFASLRMESDEVRLHTRLISSILSYDSDRNLQTNFLETFLKLLNDVNKFELGNALIKAEHKFGEINKDKTKGGIADIYLTDGKQYIAIEVKIYAGDQPQQLIRYYNSLVEQAKGDKAKIKLFYLTLNGKKPSKQSISIIKGKTKLIEGTDYDRISFKDTILSWLKKCISHISHVTFADSDEQINLLSILNQYQSTIQKLTFMEKLREPILSNIKESRMIYSSFKDIIHGARNNIMEELIFKLNIHPNNKKNIEFFSKNKDCIESKCSKYAIGYFDHKNEPLKLFLKQEEGEKEKVSEEIQFKENSFNLRDDKNLQSFFTEGTFEGNIEELVKDILKRIENLQPAT